ncbi:hypothetical protein K8R32_04600 [bacterium]|nr:hypothetical protein [bacterium]
MKKTLKEGRELKIVIGASAITQEGWISTEEDFLNIIKEKDWDFLFNKSSIAALLAEHVWEHLSKNGGEKALKNCFQYLKPGGYLRIAVPDGFNPDQGYIDSVKPGGHGAGAESHKILFNYKSLSELLEFCGFTPELLEFFNEKREFVRRTWKENDGLIRRSRDYDKRNTSKKLNFSSLIIDAKKIK